MTIAETILARHLRHYYNEVCEIMNALEDDEITTQESEDELIALDEKYAQIIAKQFDNPAHY